MDGAWATDLEFVRNKGFWIDKDGVKRKRDDVPNVLQVPLEIPTIKYAIEAARDNDIIAISPGTYNESLIIQKSLKLRLEIPSFLPIEACRTVTVEGTDGKAALRLVSEQGSENKAPINVSCFDIIFKTTAVTLMDHTIEIDGCHLNLESCEVEGGTHALFAYNKASVEARSSVFKDAARAGVSLSSGAHALLQSCKLIENSEEGLCICGWSADRSPGDTLATLEACSLEGNRAFGLHVLGGGEVVAKGCDVRFNGQSGVHVVHGNTRCHLDTCRISDNAWFGVFVQRLNGEVPAPVSMTLCLLRRNPQGPVRAHPGCVLEASRCRGLDGPEGDAEEDVDAEGDEARVKEWLGHMGLARLSAAFGGVGILAVRDARNLSMTDMQAMGVSDLYVRRLLILRLAVPRPPRIHWG